VIRAEVSVTEETGGVHPITNGESDETRNSQRRVHTVHTRDRRARRIEPTCSQAVKAASASPDRSLLS
jgi:hypothetical protein